MYISTVNLVNLIIEVIGIVVSVFSVFILVCGISKDKRTIRVFSFGFSSLLIYHVSLLVIEFTRVYSEGAQRYEAIARRAAEFAPTFTGMAEDEARHARTILRLLERLL